MKPLLSPVIRILVVRSSLVSLSKHLGSILKSIQFNQSVRVTLSKLCSSLILTFAAILTLDNPKKTDKSLACERDTFSRLGGIFHYCLRSLRDRGGNCKSLLIDLMI